MTGRLHVPVRDFETLAAGRGDAAAVEMLWNAQLGRQTLGLLALVRSEPALTAAFDLLARAQEAAPAEAAAVLTYPHVTAWSAACLRELAGGGRPFAAGHLRNVAVAAALRAGLEFTAEAAVHDGAVCLPTLGRAQVAPAGAEGTAVVRCGPSGAEISTGRRTVAIPPDPHADAPGWAGLRILRCVHDGRVLRVHLDDLDPFRDGHRLGAAPRLTAEQAAEWRRVLADAWSILAGHHPERADAIATGLTALVPLTPRSGKALGATAAEALGAVALTPPEDPLLLAESLVHEFQHVKLSALLEVVPLTTAGPRECFYSPWRSDPRPFEGLLQGAYASLGITDFWGVQREVMTGNDAGYADHAFVLWREQTLNTVDFLAGSGLLTEAGERFVAGMRSALADRPGAPLNPLAGILARDTIDDHVLTWRLRNLRPDPALLDRLADAWPAGTPEPLVDRPALTAAPPGAHGARAELRNLLLRDPSGFAALRQEGPDAAQVRGEPAEAVAGYRARLRTGPADPDAWAGLAVAARRLGVPGAGALLVVPEVVAGVHRRIAERTGVLPDPLEVAAWLAPAAARAPHDRTAGFALPDIAVHSGIGSMSHSSRRPSAASAASG
ncbi:HEXXH motif domain-containing protein [Thermomonospora cellulosilytica]|uniref:HEXXH motif-containing protein n=1 Tax=Thermomonospora cellulosilytica TaxID=1411118 RepID=A0A7W3MYU5_9ACTN|nr:HEXXH motif domain-containing protein [Thermomonospora cellulosilytica]MBA9004376.1 HEXXH motif-containing protein [Thermomonospora cellulosilytica]